MSKKQLGHNEYKKKTNEHRESAMDFGWGCWKNGRFFDKCWTNDQQHRSASSSVLILACLIWTNSDNSNRLSERANWPRRTTSWRAQPPVYFCHIAEWRLRRRCGFLLLAGELRQSDRLPFAACRRQCLLSWRIVLFRTPPEQIYNAKFSRKIK
jgi:hypothetical protein